MKKKLNTIVLVDNAEIPPGDPDFLIAPEEPTTEYDVIETLRALGHNVLVLGAVQDIAAMVAGLEENRADIVFNLTEHLGGDRRLDKNIAALLEILEIPFTGAGSIGLLLSRNKGLCKQLLGAHRIRVPRFVLLPPNRTVRIPRTLDFPLVIKPAFEDSSEGISNASVVNNMGALEERVKFVHEKWHQAAIAEEYVVGREFYVTILGNKRLSVLPIRECRFNSEGNEGPCLATYRVKWNEEYRKKWKIEFGFAELETSVTKEVQRICKKVYRILQLRDYGRIDIRLTSDNRIYILEANSNPDLAYGEEVAESAERLGISYEDFIKKILNIALKRYG